MRVGCVGIKWVVVLFTTTLWGNTWAGLSWDSHSGEIGHNIVVPSNIQTHKSKHTLDQTDPTEHSAENIFFKPDLLAYNAHNTLHSAMQPAHVTDNIVTPPRHVKHTFEETAKRWHRHELRRLVHLRDRVDRINLQQRTDRLTMQTMQRTLDLLQQQQQLMQQQQTHDQQQLLQPQQQMHGQRQQLQQQQTHDQQQLLQPQQQMHGQQQQLQQQQTHDQQQLLQPQQQMHREQQLLQQQKKIHDQNQHTNNHQQLQQQQTHIDHLQHQQKFQQQTHNQQLQQQNSEQNGQEQHVDRLLPNPHDLQQQESISINKNSPLAEITAFRSEDASSKSLGGESSVKSIEGGDTLRTSSSNSHERGVVMPKSTMKSVGDVENSSPLLENLKGFHGLKSPKEGRRNGLNSVRAEGSVLPSLGEENKKRATQWVTEELMRLQVIVQDLQTSCNITAAMHDKQEIETRLEGVGEGVAILQGSIGRVRALTEATQATVDALSREARQTTADTHRINARLADVERDTAALREDLQDVLTALPDGTLTSQRRVRKIPVERYGNRIAALTSDLSKVQESSVQLLETLDNMEIRQDTDRAQLLREVAKLEFNMHKGIEEHKEELKRYQTSIKTELGLANDIQRVRDEIKAIKNTVWERSTERTDTNYRLETVENKLISLDKRMSDLPALLRDSSFSNEVTHEHLTNSSVYGPRRSHQMKLQERRHKRRRHNHGSHSHNRE